MKLNIMKCKMRKKRKEKKKKNQMYALGFKFSKNWSRIKAY